MSYNEVNSLKKRYDHENLDNLAENNPIIITR